MRSKIFGKEEALHLVDAAMAQRRHYHNRELAPIGIWNASRIAKGDESWALPATKAGLKETSSMSVGQRSLSHPRLMTLATALDSSDSDFQNLASSDVYWDEIISIEGIGNGQVYDLTIPGHSQFCCQRHLRS